MNFLFTFTSIIYGFNLSPKLSNLEIYEFLNLINSGHLVLITHSDCYFCTEAKNRLDFNNYYYNEVDVNKNWKVKKYLDSMYGSHDFPSVFFNGVFEPNFDKLSTLMYHYENLQMK